MLNPSKASPEALLNAAQSLFDRGRYAEAQPLAQEVLQRSRRDPAALALMAEILAATGKPNLDYYIVAISENPGEIRYQQRLLELGGGALKATKYSPEIEKMLVAFLTHPDKVDCQQLCQLWLSHLLFIPSFLVSWNLNKMKWFDPANKNILTPQANFKALLTPYFILGLRHLLLNNPVAEEFITYVRKTLLDDHGVWEKLTREESVTLASAVAQYAFSTDYILDDAEEGAEKVAALAAKVEGGSLHAADIALLACYMPLYRVKNVAAISARFSADPDIGGIIRQQVMERQELVRAAAGITAVTEISEGVSRHVQSQYEESPYPRWQAPSARSMARDQGWMKDARDTDIPVKKILVAGCGTGCDATVFSLLYPHAEILAVDLSRSSLAYAVTQAKKLGVTNITFRHGDILKLGQLEQKFDHIVSGGVLHHLKDPRQGWNVLHSLLVPGGGMTIALYSKAARWAVIMAQEARMAGGYQAEAASMRAFRRLSPGILPPEAMQALVNVVDYYHLSMYRDLLFHVQDYNYTIPELEALFEELGMTFEGFMLPQPVLDAYSRMFPGDPQQTNLKNWHQFEMANPDIFRNMYRFHLRKAA